MARRCPVAGCFVPRRRGEFACVKHWEGLPLHIQRAVRAAFTYRQTRKDDALADVAWLRAQHQARRFWSGNPMPAPEPVWEVWTHCGRRGAPWDWQLSTADEQRARDAFHGFKSHWRQGAVLLWSPTGRVALRHDVAGNVVAWDRELAEIGGAP